MSKLNDIFNKLKAVGNDLKAKKEIVNPVTQEEVKEFLDELKKINKLESFSAEDITLAIRALSYIKTKEMLGFKDDHLKNLYESAMLLAQKSDVFYKNPEGQKVLAICAKKLSSLKETAEKFSNNFTSNLDIKDLHKLTREHVIEFIKKNNKDPNALIASLEKKFLLQYMMKDRDLSNESVLQGENRYWLVCKSRMKMLKYAISAIDSNVDKDFALVIYNEYISAYDGLGKGYAEFYVDDIMGPGDYDHPISDYIHNNAILDQFISDLEKPLGLNENELKGLNRFKKYNSIYPKLFSAVFTNGDIKSSNNTIYNNANFYARHSIEMTPEKFKKLSETYCKIEIENAKNGDKSNLFRELESFKENLEKNFGIEDKYIKSYCQVVGKDTDIENYKTILKEVSEKYIKEIANIHVGENNLTFQQKEENIAKQKEDNIKKCVGDIEQSEKIITTANEIIAQKIDYITSVAAAKEKLKESSDCYKKLNEIYESLSKAETILGYDDYNAKKDEISKKLIQINKYLSVISTRSEKISFRILMLEVEEKTSKIGSGKSGSIKFDDTTIKNSQEDISRILKDGLKYNLQNHNIDKIKDIITNMSKVVNKSAPDDKKLELCIKNIKDFFDKYHAEKSKKQSNEDKFIITCAAIILVTIASNILFAKFGKQLFGNSVNLDTIKKIAIAPNILLGSAAILTGYKAADNFFGIKKSEKIASEKLNTQINKDLKDLGVNIGTQIQI